MKGTLILSNNYTYDGDIRHHEPHGYGKFTYVNGHKYIGHCVLGKADGFGTYYYDANTKYVGYFSCGMYHGIGTYENPHLISKGHWRNDLRHGYFLETNKVKSTTTRQLWHNNRLKAVEPVQYLQPDCLQTTKVNPIKIHKTRQVSYKAIEKKCIACNIAPMNATIVNCGHVCMCYECLLKCGDKCPICRGTLDKVVKLFVS
jgi:hypothetical protein